MNFPLTLYPDPGSNRDGLPHWCLRPARLPIPPSGLKCVGKGSESFYFEQKNVSFFAFLAENDTFLNRIGAWDEKIWAENK